MAYSAYKTATGRVTNRAVQIELKVKLEQFRLLATLCESTMSATYKRRRRDCLPQGALISQNDLRTPAILTTSVVFCYCVSCLLAMFQYRALDIVADVFMMLTYCSLALIASWLLLRYGTTSSDVVVAIDLIANFFFALVIITTAALLQHSLPFHISHRPVRHLYSPTADTKPHNTKMALKQEAQLSLE